MTGPAAAGDWGDHDPLDEYIALAQRLGWSLIPQVGHGTCDNALMRQANGFVDIVTILDVGHSTVVRLQGGPEPGCPRRTGHQWWRHLVPPDLAVKWALSDCANDDLRRHGTWRAACRATRHLVLASVSRKASTTRRNEALLGRESPCHRTLPCPDTDPGSGPAPMPPRSWTAVPNVHLNSGRCRLFTNAGIDIGLTARVRAATLI